MRNLVKKTLLKRSWPLGAFILCVIVSFSILFYVQSKQVLKSIVRSHLVSTTGIAAEQFRGEDLNDIQSENDVSSKKFLQIATQLNTIRHYLPNVRYIYIMRRTEEENMLEFVVDADVILGPQDLDINRNGRVDTNEEAALPGRKYDITNIPALQRDAFQKPTADKEYTVDEWGAYMSGYAPIRNKDGSTAAILGIDIAADDYSEAMESIFSQSDLVRAVILAALLSLMVVLIFWNFAIHLVSHMEEDRTNMLRFNLHQVGTPLTILRWTAESLHSRFDSKAKNDDDLHDDLRSLDNAIDRLSRVNSVLTMAETVQNSIVLDAQSVNPVDVVEEVVGGMQAALNEKKQEAEIQIEGDISVKVDQRLMVSAVREILRNASIYSPEKSKIFVHVIEYQNGVSVTIADQGCGIPSSDLENVFKKFTRGSNAGLFDTEGTGFGLYIAKGMIEKAGGTLIVNSIVGEGTTVSFTVPGVKE